jgi:hypothetical protein
MDIQLDIKSPMMMDSLLIPCLSLEMPHSHPEMFTLMELDLLTPMSLKKISLLEEASLEPVTLLLESQLAHLPTVCHHTSLLHNNAMPDIKTLWPKLLITSTLLFNGVVYTLPVIISTIPTITSP